MIREKLKYILAAGSFAVFCVALLGVNYMLDPKQVPGCYVADHDEWVDILSSYERGTSPVPAAPTRDITFVLEFPFPVDREDTILVEAYGQGRGVAHRIYDGPPPPGGRLSAQLAVPAEDASEVFWMSVELVREADRMTCGWNAEERFDLPAPPSPATWRVTLLRGETETADGGMRRTEISAVD